MLEVAASTVAKFVKRLLATSKVVTEKLGFGSILHFDCCRDTTFGQCFQSFICLWKPPGDQGHAGSWLFRGDFALPLLRLLRALRALPAVEGLDRRVFDFGFSNQFPSSSWCHSFMGRVPGGRGSSQREDRGRDTSFGVRERPQ